MVEAPQGPPPPPVQIGPGHPGDSLQLLQLGNNLFYRWTSEQWSQSKGFFLCANFATNLTMQCSKIGHVVFVDESFKNFIIKFPYKEHGSN